MKKQAVMEAKVSDIFFLLDEYLQEIYWLCARDGQQVMLVVLSWIYLKFKNLNLSY